MVAALRKKPAPSYANCRFNSVNSFVWTKGRARSFVRYSWIPEEGERTIDKRPARRRPSDYLQQDLGERLDVSRPRPIRFRLDVQLASKEDQDKGRIHDPMKEWPDTSGEIVVAGEGTRRPRFLTAGVLELTRLVEGPGTRDGAFGFDPLNLTNGIEASADEILRFRHEVYPLAAEDRRPA